MTKPWWGVTPPPRGKGYYPGEDDLTTLGPPVGNTLAVENVIEWLRSLGYTVTKGENK